MRSKHAWFAASAALGPAVAALLCLAGPSAAESLWKEGAPGMFADRRARGVGDLVTVLIVESASGSNQATAQTAKESKFSNNGAPGIGLFGFLKAFKTEASSKNDFNGSGKNDLNSKLNARLTARVVGVDPNGNLQIQGDRLVGVNNDSEEITITATVRPEDVRGDNTVLSTYLADAKIAYKGHGPNTAAQRQGLISRVLNWIF
ncbi:MAG: flagellar basal body L-ring protein FlgH [Candidatus Eisenbacteria bacterium]|nr:flagellar basal body L-ring protein FlgH [Candidatus Eisenbacteria bacterium]